MIVAVAEEGVIGLDGGIDGLVHLSDISWDENGEESVRDYKKGQELETVVLSVDPERERISLGIKQLDKDPFSNYLATNAKGDIVNGVIKEVDKRGAVITLAEGIEGYLRVSEISRDRIEDASKVLKEGDDIEARFVGVDRKNRTITLSIKAKDQAEEQAAIKSYSSAPTGKATLGDMLKAQMDEASKE